MDELDRGSGVVEVSSTVVTVETPMYKHKTMKASVDTDNSTTDATAAPLPNKPLLQLGSQGASVVELQKLLTYYGTYSGSIHTHFDTAVKDAVIAFQHRVFLVEDGIVGALTWQALYTGAPVNMPVLQRGSSGAAVVTLQQVLKNTGDFSIEVNGTFGPKTDTAVRAFQKRKGLVIDGIVGPNTWRALSKVPH